MLEFRINLIVQSGAFGEVAALVLTALRREALEHLRFQVYRVYRLREERQPLARILFAPESDRFHHAIQHLRLFTFTTYGRAACRDASIVSAAIMQISASAAIEADPTVSASNCMNCRKRPGPGFSFRNT